jgi:hypothetical protein
VMAAFSDQAHYSRDFECGWSARAESARSIAARVQTFARLAGEVEPIYGEVRPILAARAFRPTDPGPVQGIPLDALADLIDKRCRFDPPRWPAPVDPDGYDAVDGNERILLDSLNFSFKVRAGVYRSGGHNSVEGGPNKDATLWRRPDRGVALLLAYVDAWEPDWAAAAGFILASGEGADRRVPWLVWERDGFRADQQTRGFPSGVELAGPPAQVRSERGGELRIWP